MFKKQPSFSVRGVTRGADGSRASAGEVPIERDIQLDRQKVPTSVPKVAESGRPGRAELLAKKGRIVGGVGCPPNCRTSGKPRGSSDLLDPFRTF